MAVFQTVVCSFLNTLSYFIFFLSFFLFFFLNGGKIEVIVLLRGYLEIGAHREPRLDVANFVKTKVG